MKGVDISGWQAGFNVAAADADFVFIKATGGGSFTSSEFGAQTASAEASGKPHGFYHYASEKGCGADPITEANHFLNAVAGHVGPSTGLALDWEETNLGNTSWVKQWLDHVSAALGRPPSTIFLYMSQATVNAYDWSAVYGAGYRLWCAQYPTMAVQGYGPLTGPPAVNWGGQGLTMWQYSSAGRINGWGGNLDLNVLYTDWDTIHGVTGQASTITPIQEDAMTPEQAQQLKAVYDAIFTGGASMIGGKSLQDQIAAAPAAALNAPVIGPWKDSSGNTYYVSVNKQLAYNAQALAGVPASVWNQNVGGGNAAGVLNHIDQKPAVASTAGTGAPFDSDAFIARLVATLPAAIRADLKNAL
jgi:GH25 family lysozyme M1 (1,4-beta-N-acetylmuramidase)